MKFYIYFVVLTILSIRYDVSAQSVNSTDTGSINLIQLNSNRRQSFIKLLSDSLNNFKNKKLPFFVSECDFDFQNASYWDGNHQPISLRKLIFDKVTNRKSLVAIIKSRNHNYRELSKRFTTFYGKSKIPFQEKSNLQLAKQQLKFLKKSTKSK